MKNKNTPIVYKELSYAIVGVLFDVDNELGSGLQEKYYQKAIEKRFLQKGIKFRSQVPYNVALSGECIGRYFLDFLVEEKIILEIKKWHHFARRNMEQVKGYLHVTGKKLAILANFTPEGVRHIRILNLYE